jgi:hypothetical protein
MLASLSFTLLAGSRSGYLVVAPAIILFFIDYIGLIRHKDIKLLPGLISIAGGIIAFIYTHMFLTWGTVNLPLYNLVFHNDANRPINIETGMEVIAMDTPVMESIAYDTRIANFLTGRNLFWMGFFRETNFLGHEYYPDLWGGARSPHNGVVGITYRYGIMAICPYVLMFANGCTQSLMKYIRNRFSSSCGFFVLVGTVGIMLVNLVENFERPLLATEWLCWYWIIGYLFQREK